MISWEWATNLWATVLLCPKVVCFKNKENWVAESRGPIPCSWREKATAIPYLSIVRKKTKRKLGGERLSAALSWMLLHKAESHSSHMRPLQGRKYSMQHWALLGGESKGQGLGLEVGEERGWRVISRGQSLHDKQSGSRCYNWWALRVKSKWQLSCDSMLWGSWPAPSLTLGEWSGGERRKK